MTVYARLNRGEIQIDINSTETEIEIGYLKMKETNGRNRVVYTNLALVYLFWKWRFSPKISETISTECVRTREEVKSQRPPPGVFTGQPSARRRSSCTGGDHGMA